MLLVRYVHDSELEGTRDPHLAVHGSFSCMVRAGACSVQLGLVLSGLAVRIIRSILRGAEGVSPTRVMALQSCCYFYR